MISVSRAIVKLENGEILLSKRGSGVTRGVGQWELPGGKADANESPEQACRRELKEETSLEATNVSLVYQFNYEDTWLVHYFDVIAEGEPTITEPEMCSELKYFPINEIKELELTEDAQEYFKWSGILPAPSTI